MLSAMNIQKIDGSGACLRTVITSLTPPVTKPSHWVTPRTLRLGVAAADFAQTVVVGIVAHAAVAGHGMGLLKVAATGSLIAAIAVATRRGIRSAGAASKNATLPLSAQAGLSTLASLYAAGAICWLLAPHATTEFIVKWFAAWATISSFLSAGLRVAAGLFTKAVIGAVGVVVVGQPGYAAALAYSAVSDRKSRWHVVEQVNVTDPDWLNHLYSTVVGRDVDVVVLALANQGEESQIAEICSGLADQPVRICLAIDTMTVGRPPAGLERFGRAILIDLVGDPHAGLGGAAKRVIDVVLSAAAIVVLIPAFLLITLLIRWESPGPAIFRQKRFGLGGRAIEVLKFRSMYLASCDVTGEQRTLARDPRVTPVGRVLRRLSLDELPQLFNVLRGDMSLVGPRPHPLHMRVGEAYYFDVVLQYRTRHIVKPGITGWAQVNGSRGEVNNVAKARRRVELDLWYLENWSLLLDFVILLRTVWGGFVTKGAD